MRTLHRNHLERAFLFFLTFTAKFSGVPSPIPTPLNECIVTPPMLHAAMPVEAVIATASCALPCFFRSALIISRSNTDLPVPMKYPS
ncbi:hypothetical protein B0J17DRAFT_580921 [Rhizoctonia solani]|nr:hypothetical protein B0J17DRAFT_580921 [Rhizoctonia solani]